MGGEAGERREGRGGEEGGVQADEGVQDDPREEVWDPGLHGAQAVASVRGGEGGPDSPTLPPTAENRSLAGDCDEVPIMLMPREAPSI